MGATSLHLSKISWERRVCRVPEEGVVMRSTHPPFGQVQACENRGWGRMRRRVNPPHHPFPTICSIFCCCFCAKGWERWLAAFWLEGEKRNKIIIEQYTVWVYSNNNNIIAENLSNVIKNWTFLPHPLSNLTSRLFWHRRQWDIIYHGWLVVCRVSQSLSQGGEGERVCEMQPNRSCWTTASEGGFSDNAE